MKIGLFGGTFDPPHIGHLIAAQIAVEEAGLDQVIFIPAGVPPHKQGKAIVAGRHRLNMVTLAIQGHPSFSVSDWELQQAGPSYTADTLRHFTAIDQADRETEWYWLVGADMLADLPQWHEVDAIFEKAKVIAVARPGTDAAILQGVIEEKLPKWASRVVLIHNIGLEVSSTWIRERLSHGTTVQHVVPAKVIEYINQNFLYKDRQDSPSMEQVEQRLKIRVQETLSQRRFQHVQGVVQTADELARIHEVDPLRARVAAWLHDIAREWSREQLIDKATEYGIDAQYFAISELLHGHIAAVIGQREYGITDEELLDAVRFHTSARPKMSILEKLIFLADATEPGRTYPEIEELREQTKKNLNAAMSLSLDQTLIYLIHKHQPIFPLTVEARNDYIS